LDTVESCELLQVSFIVLKISKIYMNVTIIRIKKALAKFYRRLFSDTKLAAPGALVFVVALRAW
jgi:hypothetical protein